MGVSADKRGALRSAMGSLIKEALTGTVKKTMMIANVEQVDLGNIMELRVIGHVLKWAGQTHLRESVAEQCSRMEPEKSHSIDSCQPLS